MKLDFQSDKPLFLQIAEEIEDAIFIGAFPEESQVPSTTEVSMEFQINPATVLKGITQLVDAGILYKRRGVGMFVKEGAVARIREKRQSRFYDDYILSMVKEARKLRLAMPEVEKLVKRGFEE